MQPAGQLANDDEQRPLRDVSNHIDRTASDTAASSVLSVTSRRQRAPLTAGHGPVDR
jgi:hypothetical protein